jgi:hypothetical protein
MQRLIEGGALVQERAPGNGRERRKKYEADHQGEKIPPISAAFRIWNLRIRDVHFIYRGLYR